MLPVPLIVTALLFAFRAMFVSVGEAAAAISTDAATISVSSRQTISIAAARGILRSVFALMTFVRCICSVLRLLFLLDYLLLFFCFFFGAMVVLLVAR